MPPSRPPQQEVAVALRVGKWRGMPRGARSISVAAASVDSPGCTPNAAAVALTRLTTPSSHTERPTHISAL